MKKFLFVCAVNAVAAGVFAQGTVISANGPGTLFRTNSLADFGTAGNIAPTPGGFYFEVLTAPSTVTSVDSSLQGLLSAPWSDTGLRMTNATTILTGGRVNGPSFAGGVVNNWPVFQINSFIVVGWSANQGTTWAQVASELQGASFRTDALGSHFEGPLLASGGFIGATTIQQGAAGEADGSTAFSLFGFLPNAQGTPITTPTDLYIIFIPEPSAVAFAGVAMAIFVLRRRRLSANLTSQVPR